MDSALECFTFALNAMGWVVMPSGFRRVTDAKELKWIKPADILGDTRTTPPTQPRAGYQAVFPTVQRTWLNELQLIDRIRDLHDVSKHRQSIFVGGQLRLDPPDGFYEAFGFPEDSRHRDLLLTPMAEILLKDDPKLPAIRRTPKAARQGELLEDLVPSFAILIKATGMAALGDAQTNVPLKEKNFRE